MTILLLIADNRSICKTKRYIDAQNKMLYNEQNMKCKKEAKSMKRATKDIVLEGICVIVVLIYMKLIGCPIRWATGIPCAGCGMTRAWIAVLHLDFQKAYYYHPLYPLPLIALLLFWAKKKISPVIYKSIFYGMALLFVGVYGYRLVTGDDVLAIDVQSGIVFQIISYLRGG